MPVLEALGAGEGFEVLQGLSPVQVRAELPAILSALAGRSVVVRWAAVRALGRAGLGGPQLERHLARERNELVLCEVCDALVSARRTSVLGRLKRLAARHRSPLVRSYALFGVADLGGPAELPFLRAELRRQRSTRVRARLLCVLVSLGEEDLLPELEAMARLRDAAIRGSIATLLEHYRPRRLRRQLVALLRRTLEDEERPGLRTDLEKTISVLAPPPRRRSDKRSGGTGSRS